jgi:KaiC/GvpD/RAD55 family RecA-like ATPase
MNTWDFLKRDEYSNRLLVSIAYHWIMFPKERARFLQNGIKFQDWPLSEPRQWIEQAERGNDDVHELKFRLAQHKAEGDFLELPTDDMELKAAYFSFIKKEKAISLAKKILNNPLDLDSLLYAHSQDKSTEIETKELADIVLNAQELIMRGLLSEGYKTICPAFEKLTTTLSGFQPGRVILLAAKTGIGKTTFATNLAVQFGTLYDVLFLNMEVSYEDFGRRALSILSGYSLTDLENGKIVNNRLVEEAIQKTKSLKVQVTNGRGIDLNQMAALILAKKKQGPLIVFVDYDQKIGTEHAVDEWKALHQAIQKLEDTAKHVECCIILLSQADDTGDPRASKRMIQSASALIVFDQNENGQFILKFRKNRFGPTNKIIELEYKPETGQIKELDYVSITPKEIPKRRHSKPIQGIDD